MKIILYQVIAIIASLLTSAVFILGWNFISWENHFLESEGLEHFRIIAMICYSLYAVCALAYSLESRDKLLNK